MNVAAINRVFGSRHVPAGDECYDNVVEFCDSEVVRREENIAIEIRALCEILQQKLFAFFCMMESEKQSSKY